MTDDVQAHVFTLNAATWYNFLIEQWTKMIHCVSVSAYVPLRLFSHLASYRFCVSSMVGSQANAQGAKRCCFSRGLLAGNNGEPVYSCAIV